MKTAIIFYSLTGRTKHLGQEISKMLNADLFELIMKNPYSYAGSYTRGLADIVRKAKPALKNTPDLQKYEFVILCTPIWYATYIPVFNTLLAMDDLGGKKVAVFATHQGDSGNTFSKLADMIKGDIVVTQDFFDNNISRSYSHRIAEFLKIIYRN